MTIFKIIISICLIILTAIALIRLVVFLTGIKAQHAEIISLETQMVNHLKNIDETYQLIP